MQMLQELLLAERLCQVAMIEDEHRADPAQRCRVGAEQDLELATLAIELGEIDPLDIPVGEKAAQASARHLLAVGRVVMRRRVAPALAGRRMKERADAVVAGQGKVTRHNVARAVQGKVDAENPVGLPAGLDGVNPAIAHPSRHQKREIPDMRTDIEHDVAGTRLVLRNTGEKDVPAEAVGEHVLVEVPRR
ncbi:MAG: hypothetical protein R3C69_08120 [Geminicoccaceae bacterium]